MQMKTNPPKRKQKSYRPGSQWARKHGCTCDEEENAFGRGAVREPCPVCWEMGKFPDGKQCRNCKGKGELVKKSNEFLINVGYPGHPGCPLHAPETRKREEEYLKEYKKAQVKVALQKAQGELWQQIINAQMDRTKESKEKQEDAMKPLKFKSQVKDGDEWN